jgi:hypothetical protein
MSRITLASGLITPSDELTVELARPAQRDAAPRRALWSHNEPVSILGALRNAYGQHEVEESFTWLERSFSDCTYAFEFATLSGPSRKYIRGRADI